jgi:phosphoribosyl 1,2-cyclic phosphodiesterase
LRVMPLFFQVLASGSKGNAILVCSPRTRILVDAGLTGKELVRRLDGTPVKAQELNALLISHEHQDHVRGAGVVSRRYDLPVYVSRGTLENLPSSVGNLAYQQIFQSGGSFCVGDLQIHPFHISHDANEPAGFIIEHESTRLGVCTDLGAATQLVRIRLKGCHGLILEANHDVDMLLNGPYPWDLKQRIRSKHGHLSNAETFELLETLHHEELRAVIFAHLSEINNDPDLVFQKFKALCQDLQWQDVSFSIGNQYEAISGVELP